MKRLFFIIFVSILFVSCGDTSTNPQDISEYKVIVYDDCEYVTYQNRTKDANSFMFSITHKGNCKFCALRK